VKKRDKRPLPFRLQLLKWRQQLDRLLNAFFVVARLDARLKLSWIRALLLPVTLLPLYKNPVLWLSSNLNLPAFHKATLAISNVYIWLENTGLLEWIFTLCALSFISVAQKISKLEENLGKRISIKGIIQLGIDLFFLYSSVKYMIPWLIPLLKWAVIIYVLLTPFLLWAYRKHQKEHGPFDPGPQLKREVRKLEKRERKAKKQQRKHHVSFQRRYR
jgi:hypothetical protein